MAAKMPNVVASGVIRLRSSPVVGSMSNALTEPPTCSNAPRLSKSFSH